MNLSRAIPIATMIACVPAATAAPRSHFVAITSFRQFKATTAATTGEIVLLSPAIETPLAWDELVVSWNCTTSVWLRVEARAIRSDGATKFYSLGHWSSDPGRHPRESVKLPADPDGEVKTDTLVLKQHARAVQLRVTLGGATKPEAQLKFLGLSFLDSRAPLPVLKPDRAAWGRVLDVPERSQLAHAGGREWCAPTSLSMVLAHWSREVRRPELDCAVPATAAAVHDPNWGGTGNWPFNTAFAGSFAGMCAFVTRLDGIPELERWIKTGVPVVISGPYHLFQGRKDGKSMGHLITVVGFTETGDVVVNDPWSEAGGKPVRRVYRREDVSDAWSHSRNTAWLIFPETIRPPRDPFGHWSGKPKFAK